MVMQTEFVFSLPRGLVDSDGNLHHEGVMRLATAQDEIESLNDPRVQVNEAYLPVVLLSRVIQRLGSLAPVGTQYIENLFATDMAYLEDLYIRLNSYETVLLSAVCPNCSINFNVQVMPLGTTDEVS